MAAKRRGSAAWGLVDGAGASRPSEAVVTTTAVRSKRTRALVWLKPRSTAYSLFKLPCKRCRAAHVPVTWGHGPRKAEHGRGEAENFSIGNLMLAECRRCPARHAAAEL